jgi:hypothetical protein
MKRRRVEVNVGELDQLLEGAKQAPLSDPDCFGGCAGEAAQHGEEQCSAGAKG